MATPRVFRDPRIDRLPGQLKPVAEICGYDGVMRLLEYYAGQEVYVPTVARAGRTKMAQLCGPGVAKALSQIYGRNARTIKIPLAEGLRTEAKHRAINADRRKANAVARELGMHVDSVHRIRAGRGAKHRVSRETRQPGLFDQGTK